METFIKDPDAVIDFKRDWSDWLATNETITASSWIASSDDITMDSDTNTTVDATVWLSGGTDGASYKLTNRITTNQGRTDDRTFIINCEER